MKTVYEMCKEGWCDDCLGNPAICLKNSRCEGYKKEDACEDTEEFLH